MDKKFLLKEIAEIISGFQFRGRIEPDEEGIYRVIQMKDFAQKHERIFLVPENMVRTRDYGFQERYFAKADDIVFCSRGNNNFSLHLIVPPENTIISSQFFILRSKEAVLIPGYLYWFLNQPITQKLLAGIRRGTTTQMITTKELSEIEVPVPDIETQKKIAEVFRLQIKEKELFCSIQKKQDEILENLLMRKAEGIAL